MAIGGDEIRVLLFDHKTTRIGAEGPDEVVVPASDYVKLRVPVYPGDGIHYDRGHLYPDTYIQGPVPGLDSVPVQENADPLCSYPAWSQQDPGGLLLCAIGQPDSCAPLALNNQILRPAVQPEHNSPPLQIHLERGYYLGRSVAAHMALIYGHKTGSGSSRLSPELFFIVF